MTKSEAIFWWQKVKPLSLTFPLIRNGVGLTFLWRSIFSESIKAYHFKLGLHVCCYEGRPFHKDRGYWTYFGEALPFSWLEIFIILFSTEESGACPLRTCLLELRKQLCQDLVMFCNGIFFFVSAYIIQVVVILSNTEQSWVYCPINNPCFTYIKGIYRGTSSV
jgi:hypothetical protein